MKDERRVELTASVELVLAQHSLPSVMQLPYVVGRCHRSLHRRARAPVCVFMCTYMYVYVPMTNTNIKDEQLS